MATGIPGEQVLPSRPRHSRQLSSKSTLLKALVSPVKTKIRSAVHNGDEPVLSERSHNMRSPPRARSCHDKSRGDVDNTKLISTTLQAAAGAQILVGSSVQNSALPIEQRLQMDRENTNPSAAGTLSKTTTRQESSPSKSSKRIPLQPPQTPGTYRNASPRKISDSSAETLSPRKPLSMMKRGARVMAAVAAIQGKSTPCVPTPIDIENLDPDVIERRFEAMLSSRNIAPAQREQMRNLTLRMKIDLVKQHQGDLESTSARSSYEQDPHIGDQEGTSAKRSRSRGRSFTFTRSDRHAGDGSPTKKQRGRSRSRPAPIETTDLVPVQSISTPITPRSRSAKGSRSENPADYIAYLTKEQDPVKVEVGRLHKLRILLRNETVSWVDSFIELDGLSQIAGLLHRVMSLEWREDHEDQLLHETLLCLKGLCTTDKALDELCKFADNLLPALLGMLFDEERKGPAEYTTRAVVINVLFAYLSARAYSSPVELETRARAILGYLSGCKKDSDSAPLDFVMGMRLSRPYKDWCKEVTNVTREVFWIFLHQINVVPVQRSSATSETNDTATTYTRRHFPGTRPPVPAAPYVGGVEWDATTYITAHLDLMNGLIASLPTKEARDALRQELRDSGFEKTMGTTLRTCKEKFYGGVHDGLRAWVAAATEDDWPTLYVCEGPTLEEQARSARASPKKSPSKAEAPPKLAEIKPDVPKLDLNLTALTNNDNDIDWLG